LDQGIYYLQKTNTLRTSIPVYLLIQIVAWMVLFYGMFHYLPKYSSEFQGALTGVFFITLFFIVQTNFVKNIQSVLGMIDTDLHLKKV